MTDETLKYLPENILIGRCPVCDMISTSRDAYFDVFDSYDIFEEVADPDNGYLIDSAGFTCPYCGEYVIIELTYEPTGFDIEATYAPPPKEIAATRLFAPAPKKQSLFKLFGRRRK